MNGKVFLLAVIIFDLLLILLAYLTYKSKNKRDSIIVFFSLVLFVFLSEFAARKYLYNNNSFNFVLKEPVFFEYERKNFREKYHKCALKKANFYSKLYFFSATKNTNCDGWSTIKSTNGPWIRNTVNFSNSTTDSPLNPVDEPKMASINCVPCSPFFTSFTIS